MPQDLDLLICSELLPVLTELGSISDRCGQANFVMQLEQFWLNWETLLDPTGLEGGFNACDIWTYRLNEPGSYEKLSAFCQGSIWQVVRGLRELAQIANRKLMNTGTLVLFNPNTGRLTECIGAYEEELGAVNIEPLFRGYSTTCPDCRYVWCVMSGGVPATPDWTDACCKEVGFKLQQILDILKTI